MAKIRRKSNHCYNCRTTLSGDENFCPNCGQENHGRQATTGVLVNDFIQDFFTFDSKFFRSITPLLFAPGKMTKEYLDGKRKKYIAPIRFYLFLSFIYFGLSYFTSEVAVDSITINGNDQDSEAGQQLLTAFQNNLNLMVFAFVPLQGLLIMIFFKSEKRKYYVNFFVYALHLFTLFFLIATLSGLIEAGAEQLFAGTILATIKLSLWGIIIIYVSYYSYKSLKVVFEKKHTILYLLIVVLMSSFIFLASMLGFLFLISWLYLGV